MKATITFIAVIALAGCASSDTKNDPAIESGNPSQAQSLKRKVYDLLTCHHCDKDFQRVALPDGYDLPTENVYACFTYVIDQNPNDRDLLISAWMSCSEAATANAKK